MKTTRSNVSPIPGSWQTTEAVGAIITVGAGGYLLQLRDERPGIWYPGYWGLFGGTRESGEGPEAALRRELAEELSLDFGSAIHLMHMSFGFARWGRPIHRDIFEVRIPRGALSCLRLSEGQQVREWQAEDVGKLKLVPADRVALDFHIACTQCLTDQNG